MAREFVNYQVEERIALVTVDRAPVNALNEQVQTEIGEVFDELETHDGVGAIIMTGGGDKAFMAGADIKMISKATEEGSPQMGTGLSDALCAIEQLGKVVIAAINGLALGGGCEVALACDIRVVDEKAMLGLPEVSLGVFPGAGGTQRLPRVVGVGKARELILTGDPIDAAEAKAIGLVERVAPAGKSVEEAKKIARRIMLRGPLAVANAKKSINEGLDLPLKEGLKREAQLFMELLKTEDVKEGISAFFEKRKPEFAGK